MEESSGNEVEEQNIEYKPSTNAEEFLKSITSEKLKLCLFEDDLVRISDDGSHLGEFSIKINKTTKAGEELLLIHATSQGKIENYPEGFMITCLAREDLSVVEQSHTEYIKVPQHELEKKTTITRSDDGSIIVNRQITKGQETRNYEYQFSKESTKCLITEGTNLVLQRLLVKSGINEEFSFVSIDMESGIIVPNIYKTLPERSQSVGSQTIDVVGVERTLVSNVDLPHSWQSYFMDDGHLTMRVQVGSPTIVLVEKVPYRIEPDVIEARLVFGKKVLDWEEDAEMHSKFLQRKEELKADHQSYIRSHPETRALLSDYFQYLLLHKPDDVISFSADYFASFSATAPDPPSHKQAVVE